MITNLGSVRLQEVSPLHPSQLAFMFKHRYGYLSSLYTPEDGRYLIDDIEVERRERSQGIGKLLLRHAEQHAQILQSRVIVATIISRECIDAMSTVFGTEHVEVRDAGEYGGDGDEHLYDASAILYKRL